MASSQAQDVAKFSLFNKLVNLDHVLYSKRNDEKLDGLTHVVYVFDEVDDTEAVSLSLTANNSIR